MASKKHFILSIYRRMGLFTCSSVFLLFVLGGLVRATGSGMGCPDWPKCFGLWAPPTCDCKLPANYQDVFLQKRLQKVERLTKVLYGVGLKTYADRLKNDPAIMRPEAFDFTKAWIEYINRLFGVLSGLFALAYLLIMLFYRSQIPKGKLWGVVGLILLLLNGWLGSLVVATNLLPGIVTLHFVLSFMCLFAFIISIHRLQPFRFEGSEVLPTKQWRILFWVMFAVVILGTWSREQVDVLRLNNTLYADGDTQGFMGFGMLNIFAMDLGFVFHRYLPLIILGWAIVQLRKCKSKPLMTIAMMLVLQITLGVIHVWFVVPSWTQVSHVAVGSALITYIFAVYLSGHQKSIL